MSSVAHRGAADPHRVPSSERTDLVLEATFDRWAFGLLLPLLLAWYAWCRLRGRIESRASFIHACVCALRGPVSGSVGRIMHEEGYCYRADVPGALMDNARGRSAIEVLESGRPLGPAHSHHEDVRRLGGGRFNHWEGYLWFSSSDNSDPRENGRNYTFREVWS